MLQRATVRLGAASSRAWTSSFAARASIQFPRAQQAVRRCASNAKDKAAQQQKQHTVHSTMRQAASDASSSMQWLRAHFPQISAGLGGVVVVYGVTRFVLWMTNQFMATTLTDAAWLGFLIGFSAAGASAGALYMGSRALMIRPERVYRTALRMVRGNEQVKNMLGLHVNPGALRAYTLRDGGVSLCESTYVPQWVEPRVQMMFQVTGDFGTGMVTAEAVKHFPNKLHVTLVTVDPVGTGGHMVMVEGAKDRLHVRGQLRGFLQSERVEYIEQTRPADTTGDEEWEVPPAR